MAGAPPPEPYSPDWLNALSIEERIAVHKGIFGQSLHRDGSSHVTWVYLTQGSTHLSGVFGHDQGSMFFLDCGQGPFAVTADHVYQGFLNLRDKGQLKGFQVANLGIDLEERLISRGLHHKIDIATFRVTEQEIAEIGKNVVRGSPGAWPAPPKEGDLVFFSGFPGQATIQTDLLEASFGLHSGLCPVTTTTDHQLKCHFDLTSRVDTIGNGLPPPGYQLGGISGGPLLVPYYDQVAKTWGWRLGGVISEAIATPDYEILTAVRAHFIHPDGRVGWPAVSL